MKEKEEATERMLNEIGASQISDTKFKAIVIRKLTDLKRITRNYRETAMNSLLTVSI